MEFHRIGNSIYRDDELRGHNESTLNVLILVLKLIRSAVFDVYMGGNVNRLGRGGNRIPLLGLFNRWRHAHS